MDFAQLREELQRLNNGRQQVLFSEKMRKNRHLQDAPKTSIRFMTGVNPERLTWEALNQEVATLEEQIVRETGFGVEYWVHPTLGEEAGTYVLAPKNPGWLEVKRRETTN